MLTINRPRFLDNLAELSRLGRVPDEQGGGLDRRPFSPAERAARGYFVAQAEAAGLDLQLDGAANLSARLLVQTCRRPHAAPRLAPGHSAPRRPL